MFLTEVHKRGMEEVSESFMKKLAIDRKLPIKAFRDWEISKYGNRYLLPIRNEKGAIQDLRSYTIGSKMRSTSSCYVGLLGLSSLLKSDVGTLVYVCEGEWDGIALTWLLSFLKAPGVVVAVPGAAIFKREWISWFNKRDVCCCYDHDDAGRKGELVLQERLTGTARSLRYLHWPVEFVDGYDIRDLIVEKAIKQQKPRTAYSFMKEKFQSIPREVKREGQQAATIVVTDKTPEPKKVSIIEVYKVLGKWLYLKDYRGIEVSLATVLSNELEGDPLWMFLVSSPGGAKTEILQSLNKCSNVYVTSSLTSHALISGASFINGRDPSLLPHLHQKTLVIKDFTTILAKKEQEKEEIFGILRDAYDGSSSKVFGNGQKREYVSHFSILAGVTPRIYELSAEHQSFGERFLKFTMGDNLHHAYEIEMMNQAADNVGSEDEMRAEIATITQEFMVYHVWLVRQYDPTIPQTIKTKLISLSQFGARMRGSVSRDKYRSDIMTSKPAAEYGTRIVKQLVKLMKALAYVNNRRVVNEQDYEVAKKVMLSTISQRIEDVVRVLHFNTPTINDTLKTKDIAIKTKYTIATISHILANLDILGIVVKTGKQNIYEWTLSKYIRDLIAKARIY